MTRPTRPPLLRVVLAACAVCLLATACGASDGTAEGDGAASGGPRIATTVAPITSIVANIAGPDATVTGIVPEGSNSHTFDPSPSIARTLAQADVVFANGLQLEEPTIDLARENIADHAEIVLLGNLTLGPEEYIFDFSFPKEAGKPNPHLWTSPKLAISYATIAADTLAKRDPGHADDYRSRRDAYVAKLEAMDTAVRDATATVPEAQRKLLTYHDAYAYFAKEYGWQVVGAIQPSDFTEPTARDVAALISQIRELRVPAVFGSEVFPSPVLEQIASEAGARYVDDLRDDDLPGEPGDADHSFLALLRFNFVTMVEALGGDASALRALDVADVTQDTAEYPQ